MQLEVHITYKQRSHVCYAMLMTFMGIVYRYEHFTLKTGRRAVFMRPLNFLLRFVISMCLFYSNHTATKIIDFLKTIVHYYQCYQ